MFVIYCGTTSHKNARHWLLACPVYVQQDNEDSDDDDDDGDDDAAQEIRQTTFVVHFVIHQEGVN